MADLTPDEFKELQQIHQHLVDAGDPRAGKMGIYLASQQPISASETPAQRPGFMDVVGNFVKNGPTSFMDWATGHPLTDMSKHGRELGKQSVESFKKGDWMTGVGTGLASFLPGSGDEAIAAGQDFGESNIGGGIAHTGLALLPFAGELPRMGSRIRSPIKVGEPRIPSLPDVINTYGPEGANIHPSLKEALGYSAARKATGISLQSPIAPATVEGRVPGWVARGSDVTPVTVPEFSPTPQTEFPSGRYPGAPPHTPEAQPARQPQWSGMDLRIPAQAMPDVRPITPASGAMPSGRVPGGRDLQVSPQSIAPRQRVPLWQGVVPEGQPKILPQVEPIAPPARSPQIATPPTAPPLTAATVPTIERVPGVGPAQVGPGTIEVPSISGQKAGEFFDTYQNQKNRDAAEMAFQTLKPDELQSLLNRTMSKADLDTLLRKTVNSKTGKAYTKTELAKDMTNRPGRGFELIREHIAQHLEKLMAQAGGDIPPVGPTK